MRTKRILAAIMLAALLVVMLGAFSAGAAVSGFSLEQNGSWQQMELRSRWRETQPYAWNIYVCTSEGWIPVQPNTQGVSAREHRSEGILALVLKTPGNYMVSLTLDGTESQTYQVLLLDDTALQSALVSARALAANPNKRYDASYITQLKQAIAAADQLYTQSQGITQAMMDARVSALQTLVSKPMMAQTGFALINRIIPGWWKFVDTVTAPLRWAQSSQTLGSVITLLVEGLNIMLAP